MGGRRWEPVRPSPTQRSFVLDPSSRLGGRAHGASRVGEDRRGGKAKESSGDPIAKRFAGAKFERRFHGGGNGKFHRKGREKGRLAALSGLRAKKEKNAKKPPSRKAFVGYNSVKRPSGQARSFFGCPAQRHESISQVVSDALHGHRALRLQSD